MTVRERILVNAALLLIAGLFGVLAGALSNTAGTVPLIVACLTAGLAAAQLAIDRRSQPSTEAPVDERPLILVLVTLLFALYVAGFAAVLPAFAGLYWRWRAGASWKVSAAVAGVLFAALYGGLTLLLRIELYPGVLGEWLSR